MNNPSPLIPQGSMLEQKNKSRARVKVAFFCVVGVHVAAILVALLAQGCKREQPNVDNGQPAVPSVVDTNVAPPVGDTNVAALPVPTNLANPLPPPDVTPLPPATPSEQEYAIQKGDTFSTIAPKFHITVKALQAANPTVDPSKLQIGKKIKIPAPTASAPSATTGGTPAPVSDSGEPVYVVKSGDTLSKIATDHHTTVNAIRKANNLTTDKIKVGDKLKIPVSAPAVTPAPSAPPPAAPATGAPPQ
jgi:LysM repeat protein